MKCTRPQQPSGTRLNLRARVYTSASTLPSAAGDLFLGTFRSAGPGDMGGFGDREMGVTLEMNPRAVDQAGAGRRSKGLVFTLCTLGPQSSAPKGPTTGTAFGGVFFPGLPWPSLVGRVGEGERREPGSGQSPGLRSTVSHFEYLPLITSGVFHEQRD